MKQVQLEDLCDCLLGNESWKLAKCKISVNARLQWRSWILVELLQPSRWLTCSNSGHSVGEHTHNSMTVTFPGQGTSVGLPLRKLRPPAHSAKAYVLAVLRTTLAFLQTADGMHRCHMTSNGKTGITVH